MKEQIIQNLNNAEAFEKLNRKNKKIFI